MKTRTKLITLLASVTLLTACGNNQKAEDSFNNSKEPQTEQTTQSTETDKSTETTETTQEQTENVTHGVYVVSTDEYLETYRPQLGGTYPVGTKAFVYNCMRGKTQIHAAVIPTYSTEAGVAIFESQREATLFTQWLNSVNDKNTMQYDMQTNLDYFYTNVYTGTTPALQPTFEIKYIGMAHTDYGTIETYTVIHRPTGDKVYKALTEEQAKAFCNYMEQIAHGKEKLDYSMTQNFEYWCTNY